MLDISEDKLKNLPLRSALVQGGKDVQNVFGTRSRQLKVHRFAILVLLPPSFLKSYAFLLSRAAPPSS